MIEFSYLRCSSLNEPGVFFINLNCDFLIIIFNLRLLEEHFMSKTKWILLGLTLGAIIFTSCAGVKFEYSNPAYLNQQLSELPPELLNSKIVQNEKGERLVDPALTVGEFLIYMMASQPLERYSWFALNVVAKDEGSVITIKKYTRGNLVLVNTLYLTYQDGHMESRVDKIIWDDRRFGEKLELVSPEEKIGYSLLVVTLFALQ